MKHNKICTIKLKIFFFFRSRCWSTASNTRTLAPSAHNTRMVVVWSWTWFRYVFHILICITFSPRRFGILIRCHFRRPSVCPYTEAAARILCGGDADCRITLRANSDRRTTIVPLISRTIGSGYLMCVNELCESKTVIVRHDKSAIDIEEKWSASFRFWCGHRLTCAWWISNDARANHSDFTMHWLHEQRALQMHTGWARHSALIAYNLLVLRPVQADWVIGAFNYSFMRGNFRSPLHNNNDMFK